MKTNDEKLVKIGLLMCTIGLCVCVLAFKAQKEEVSEPFLLSFEEESDEAGLASFKLLWHVTELCFVENVCWVSL